MNLRTYLFVNEMTVKDFAAKIDAEPTYVSAIKNGRLIPGRKIARRIKESTNGEVVYLTKKEMAA